MDDFETFRASREKMDPSSRNLSDQQWQQAYAAYLSSRERVGKKSDSSDRSGGASPRKTRSKKGNSTGKRGQHGSGSVSDLNLLRHTIREQSAYSDLRLIIDILAWVAIALIVVVGLVSTFVYTSIPTAVLALLSACVQIIAVVVARMLVQVIVDIPDIALYRSRQESAYHRDADRKQ